MERMSFTHALCAHHNLQFMTKEEMQKIHSNALRLLQEVGSEVQHKEARQMLKEAGCRVEKRRVYFPPNLIEWALKQAPSHIYMYDRDGDFAMDVGGRNSYFGTGSDCTNICDSYTFENRPFTYDDMVNAAKLIDALPQLDFLMCCGLMYDYPVTSYEHQYEVMLRNSTKPQVVTAADERSMEAITKMAAVVRGSREALEMKPLFIMYNEPTSPLNHTKTAVEKLIFCAKNRIPTNYASGTLGGGTGPITVAGGLVQCIAESLVGLTISQLTRPGAPFVFGGICSNMDMHCMQVSYCSPESMVSSAAMAEIGRELYNLPTWGFAGNTGAKVPDEQAVNEAAQYTMLVGLAGVNLNHDLGFMNYGLTYSFDLLVMCDEIVSQIRKIFDGVPMDDAHIGYDTIKAVGPKGHYLAEEHTLKFHNEEIWKPGITDRNDYDGWVGEGKTTFGKRANNKVKKIIETYQPKPVTEEQDLAIKEIMAQVDAYESDTSR
ncbi:MAG: trimethylamine methyltransferase family protein [Lachnospiraceae bacterium]|nr:trimethylamine methyltransferase family protein [Lachnospiraceae bacterium]